VMVAFTYRHNSFGGSIFVKPFGEDMVRGDGGLKSDCFNVGGHDTTIWDCELQWDTSMIGVAYSCGLQLLAPSPTGYQALTNFPRLNSPHCLAVDWLDRSTIAVGCRTNAYDDEGRRLPRTAPEILHEVYLCDTRSEGVAARFRRQDRITGVHVPNDSGTNILVSSTRHIDLYDLRNLRPDRPLLSIDHLSGTTRLSTPTYGGLLAATDPYNKIQIYSLHTGKCLRAIAAPAALGLLTRPKWEEDYRGSPYLQACAGNTIQRWSWNGKDDGKQPC